MKNRTLQEWQALFKQQTASHLSITEFCKKYGIAQSSFYKQKKALSAKTTSHTPATFIKAQPPQTNHASFIKLQHQHTQLHLPKTISALWLAELIKALA